MARNAVCKVSKSVRIPVELVDYIELQEGYTFSDKLITLLDDVKNGDAKRRKMISEYDKQIDLRKQKLKELSDNMYEAAKVNKNLDRFYSSISNIVD